jgi:hypothetical protein
MWALRITRQGLGSMINPFNPVPDIKNKIEAAVLSDQSSTRVQEFSEKYAQYDSLQAIQNIANRITIMGRK